jgi:archaellum biogenesis protein FlaJ (TadC family)
MVEILGFLTAAIVILKIATVMKSQSFWFGNITSRYWKGSGNLTMILSFAVAAITLAILLQELTIVQIWAAMLFSMALISMGLAPFSKYILEAEKKWFTETNTLKTGWFPAVVWVALSVWVIISIAMRVFQ